MDHLSHSEAIFHKSLLFEGNTMPPVDQQEEVQPLRGFGNPLFHEGMEKNQIRSYTF